MPTPFVLEVSHRHDAIMQYMIACPTARLQDVAAEFKVSPNWLSCIIHSHAFKTRLRERQDQLFGDLAATITEKLESVAHAALDNLAEHLMASNANPALNLEVADKVLNRLGYGAPKMGAAQPATQVNVFQVSREDLAAARGMLAAPSTVVQLADSPTPAPEGQRLDIYSQGGDVGGTIAQPAAIPT